MNLRNLSTRAIVAGATTALAAGALVGLGSTAANAVEGTATYSCTNALVPSALPIGVTVSGDLPPSAPSGFPVPDGLLPVGVDLTVPRAVLDGLAPYGVTSVGASSSDFHLDMGATEIPINGVNAPSTAVPATGDMVLSSVASVGGFVLPKADTYDITLPEAFGLDVVTNSLGTLPFTCTIADGQNDAIGSIDVQKQGSTVTAKAPRPVKKTQSAKVPVTVKGEYATATGKVVAKEGKKTLGTGTLKDGKTTITLAKLKPGTHNVTLKYLGDASTNKNTATVKVVVKK